MTEYCMLIGVVPRSGGELLAQAAVAAGSGGGTIVMGRGTASNTILQALGFGDTAKDMVFIVTNSAQKAAVRDAMIRAAADKKPHFGILFSVKVSRLMKTGVVSGEDCQMNEKTAHRLITVIINKGFADDAMAAARKAGAGGGTIINARGTAAEGDAKFFGVEIVPEKDMLLILADSDKSDAILEAVRALPCLAKPGSGIVFCTPAYDFSLLGRKPAQDE